MIVKTQRRIGGRGWQVLFAGMAVMALASLSGCPSTHFTVRSAPVNPEDSPRYLLTNAEDPVRVQVADFQILRVDTQFPEDEKDLFRRHFAIAIPNMIQEQIGKRQVFSEVTRVSSAKPDATDYIIMGRYDFFSRLGTQGREWIPFAGAVGAKINEAWVKEDLSVRIVDAKTGKAVFEKSYPEEHRDMTSVRQRPDVGYLQAAYIAKICTEIIDSIKSQEK